MPLARAENEILKPALLKYSQQKEAERKRAEEKMNELMKEESAPKLVNQHGQPIVTEDANPNLAPTVVLPKEKQPEGISITAVYKAQVYDVKALAQAVVEGTVPAEAILPNVSYLNKTAKALKDHMKWPGVKVFKEQSVRARTGG